MCINVIMFPAQEITFFCAVKIKRGCQEYYVSTHETSQWKPLLAYKTDDILTICVVLKSHNTIYSRNVWLWRNAKSKSK